MLMHNDKYNNTVGKGKVCSHRNWASQKAHQAMLTSGFCSMKRLGTVLLPLDGIPVLPAFCQIFPEQFNGSHLYTWVETVTVRVKCFA